MIDIEIRRRFNQRVAIESSTITEIPFQEFTDLRKLSSGADLSDTLRNINGGSPEGRSYNCANCALAFEMVMRGYDVKARPMFNGSNVGNIDQYIIGGDLVRVSDKPSASLMHSFRIADNYRHRLWSMKRKHGCVSKNWRVNRKLKAALNNYFNDLDFERNVLLDMIIDDMMDRYPCEARGIMVLGSMHDINPEAPPYIYHAINYVVEENGVTFYDTQSKKNILEDDPLRHINPREVYIMRTDDKEISPRITQCVYSDTQEK